MQKAIFLDRDGVINSDVGHYYVYKPADFKINEGVIDALKILQERGYKFIIVSNQGGISRGEYTKNDVEKVHDKLLNILASEGIEVLDIYYCPHHNKFEQCLCRKPNNQSFEKAIARFSIDIECSYMIGDRDSDMQAAHSVGLHGIKIESNQNILSVIKNIK